MHTEVFHLGMYCLQRQNRSPLTFSGKESMGSSYINHCYKVKHIFYTIPIFEVMKNNLSFGFYSTCTLVLWLPNLDKFN